MSPRICGAKARWPYQPERTSIRFSFSLLIVACGLISSRQSRAESPRVSFDVNSIVACEDITTIEFATQNPDERLLKMEMDVSPILHRGDGAELKEFVYRLEALSPDFRVVDYSPKTSLESNVVGNVGVEDKKEVSKSLGINGSGSIKEVINGQASATASVGTKTHSTLRYELLPSMDTVLTSGTVSRGSGVYFKLKGNSRTALEGAKRFMVVFRAPLRWRAGLFQVSCRATGVRRGVVSSLNERIVCGENRHMVAMYVGGDDGAKSAARRYANAESHLRAIVKSEALAIRRKSLPSVAHRVGAALDLMDRRIPTDWLDQVLFGRRDSLGSLHRHLPSQVRNAADRFLEARRELWNLPAERGVKVSVSDRL